MVSKNLLWLVSFSNRLIFFRLILIIAISVFMNGKTWANSNLAKSHIENDTLGAKHTAEDLWWSIDFISFWKEVMQKAAIPNGEKEVFIKYIRSEYPNDKILFFSEAEKGKINAANLTSYLNDLKAKYISKANDYLTSNGKNFEGEMSILAANGPCVNMGFEDGNFNGWSGSTGDACTNSTPCNVSNGFVNARHTITNTTMVDPYIPALPVVAPGGNNSIRLENYVNGGDASMIRQTFLVTATNNVFTYRYAAVLEDPGDHNDNERPYFKVRMLDKNGVEIKCASYTAIAKPPIKNFTYAKVPNPNYVPGNNNAGSQQFLDLYYRSWTTVSIPLLAYVGQNVTIEFTASDCSRGGHLGYAYIDAECSYVSPFLPKQICGNQNLSYNGPDNFAGYSWSGPGIVGSKTSKNVTINVAGNYSLRLTPFADNPCPTTLNFTITQHCSPVPIQVSLCESQIGTGTVTGLNLNSYNSQITSGLPTSTVASWHTALPTVANKIANPADVTVKNGDVYYAVITYPVPGGDTSKVTFKVNGLPQINFPNIPSVCKGAPAFSITGVTPTGGIFSGTGVNAGGSFNPLNDGTFNITYSYTDINGCTNTAIKPVVVKVPPTINAGPDQAFCENQNTVNLSATVTNATGVVWSGGSGTLASVNALATSYIVSPAEISSGSVTLKISTIGTSPCSAVSDNIKISFEKIVTINAGLDQNLCSSAASVSLNGSASSGSVLWSGGNGTFNSPNSLNGTYLPSVAEKNQGSVSLNLSSTSNQLCPAVSDIVKISFDKIPSVNAGPDQALCETQSVINLSGTSSNAAGVLWSGGSGTFAAANSAVTSYTASPAEINAGVINLSIVTTGISACVPASDNLKISLEKVISIDAGPDQNLCASASTVSLNGIASSGAVLWSGGNGTFNSPNNLSGTYVPSASEISQGSVTLSLKTTTNILCPLASDLLKVSFEKIPTATAGPDQTICADNINVQLAGSLTNAVGGIWSGGNGTYQSSNTIVNPVYIPSANEVANQLVSLTFTSTGNVSCPASSDVMLIAISPVPKVDAGTDVNICKGQTNVSLNGIVQNAGGGVWSNGSGTFTPDPQNLQINYSPSSQEINNGIAQLILTSTNNGKCLPVKDSVKILIHKIPSLALGPDVIKCIGTSLNLSVMNDPTVTYSWLKNNVSYASNVNSISVQFVNGKDTYIVQGTNNHLCTSSDTIIVTGVPSPVGALKDSSICQGQSVLLHPAFNSSNNSSGLVPTYVWKKNNYILNVNDTTLLVTEPGVYEVSGMIGLCSGSTSAKITLHPNPISHLPEKAKFCSEGNAVVEIDAGPGYKYDWLKTNDTTRIIFASVPGYYQVKITNEFNCSVQDSILVLSVCPPKLFISNSFTPNTDGNNEFYNVYGVHFTNFKMLIFNRWGEIIFESTDRYKPWDGYYRGEPMPIGVYPWIITYEGDSEEYKGPYQMEGSVTVVR